MQEATFVKRNKSRWEEFEKLVKNDQRVDPDRLAQLFIQLTDDLSFARTQYPKSRVTQYLNSLTAKVHREIYRNRPEERNRFITFWKIEVPEAVYQIRKPLFYSLIIFLAATALGALSAAQDETFVRLILGDGYVNMTLESIRKGNPTRVYSMGNELDMFWMITLNNIMVSFKVFVYGVIASFGTAYHLFNNGVMMGAFVMFFYKQQELSQAFPVIMLHGTIELSSIVVAGGAGIAMGNGLLFPKTYSRMVSFKTAARRGLKVVIGLVPFFVIAGFIESFITRYGFMHWSLKVLIIGASAALIVFYFIFYPLYLNRHGRIQGD